MGDLDKTIAISKSKLALFITALLLIFSIILFAQSFITFEGVILLFLFLLFTLAYIALHLGSSLRGYQKRLTALLQKKIFDNLPNGVTITDSTGTITYVNPCFEQITGFSKHEVIGQNPSILKSGYHDNAFYTTMWNKLQQEGFFVGEIWNRKKDGSVYPEKIQISAVFDVEGEIEYIIAIFSDITVEKDRLQKLKNDKRELETKASMDNLTGLYNRRKFNDIFHREIQISNRYFSHLSLLLIDIDFFKKINDGYGHNIGDGVLKEFAALLKNSVRKTDTLARWGGEEFVLLLPKTNKSLAYILASKLLERLREHRFDTVGRVTASIGISQYDKFDTPAQFIDKADKALYDSKQNGRDRITLYQE